MNRPASAPVYACPVCEEPLTERAPRCFRCESSLREWWPLEGALLDLGSGRRERHLLWPAAALVLAVTGGFVLGTLAASWRQFESRDAQTPETLPARASVTSRPEPPAAVARVLRYHVQTGDSLWRIAAALSGEGKNWERLWPEMRGRSPVLRPGATLELDTHAIAAAESHR